MIAAAAVAAMAAWASAMPADDRRRALMLVDLLLDESRLEEADRLMSGWTEAESDRPDWLLRQARLRAAQNRAGAAKWLYKRLLKDKPDDPELLVEYGEQCRALGEAEEARRAYERAAAASKDARALYLLSEQAFDAGDAAVGRKRAEEALARLRSPVGVERRRMALRLQTRLGWKDAYDLEYARLYDQRPRDPEILAEWADALIRAGLPDAAREPVALLRERFPKPESRWRRLEAERLSAAGDEDALLVFLRESARAAPDDAALRLKLGELESSRRDWGAAESDLRAAAAGGVPAGALLADARREGAEEAGPFFVWRRSGPAFGSELGASARAYAAPRVRLDGEASRAGYWRGDTGGRALATGGAFGAAYEAPRWTAGGDLDGRFGFGRSFVSPGAAARARLGEGVEASARAWLGRAWRDAPEAAIAGARSNAVQAAAEAALLPRLSARASVTHARLSVPGGASAWQTDTVPELSVELLRKPMSLSLGWRFVAVDAGGDPAFFVALPLVRRTRANYAVLTGGRRWLEGRLRAEGYVYNGSDPGTGRRFGTDALVGLGARLEWLVGPWRLSASYDYARESVYGVAGRSESARAAVQRRWDTPRRRR